MSTKGQTINDRLNAAKYTLAGQALARCICKATTEELMKPKKKHLDYLAACTYESNVSMLQLSNMLIERTNHSNWAVVYKALITVHHLMSYGSERFTQYLASSNYSFQLSGFLDRIVAKGYAMSTYIRRYSNYINQKALSYRTLAVDLCRNQRGEDNILRTMPIERLLETLPVIHKQLDTLLDFNCSPGDLSNSIITASFTLLFHDSIRLFASYNDGIINLFEKYFDLNKKMCRDAFEAYKKFLAVTDRVADFLKVAEAINLDRGEIPDFKRAPNSLLDALEQHLISLESNKKRSDNSVVFDTKLAAFPSFSASTNLDHTPPPLATLATELDSQLSFSTSEDNELDSNKSPTSSTNTSSNSNNININTKSSSIMDQFTIDPPPPPPMPTQPPAAPESLSLIQSAFDIELSSTPFGELKKDTIFGNPSHSQQSNSALSIEAAMAAAAAANTTSSLSSAINPVLAPTQSTAVGSKTKLSAGADLFDIDPPGYSGGFLLKPEQTPQICMDPSIDPHTQQQLIQIQREQAAHKHRQGNTSSLGNSASRAGASFSTSSGFHNSTRQNNNNYSSARSNPTKAKHESIFEDLEQTMRQALQKVEKA